jgi:hypothetical protein
MDSSMADATGLYKEFLAERQEILCHKWIESEKAGCDIGSDRFYDGRVARGDLS